jgi:hypothetical protein
MNRLKRFVIFFMMLMSSFVPAEDFNEDDYFSDEDVIVEKDEIMDESTGEEMEKESVGFTGEIGSSFTYSMTQDFFQGDQGIEGNPFGVQMN